MLWRELKQLDASHHWPGRVPDNAATPMVPPDVAIPTLEEALATLAGKVGLNIQVKTTSRDMLNKIIQLYLDYELTDSGFRMLRSFEQGAWVRSRSPDVAICIGEDRHDLEKHLAFGVDYLQPNLRCLNDSYIEALIKSGMPANVFYANDRETMTTFIRKGIPGIMTDYPDLLLSLVESHSKEETP